MMTAYETKKIIYETIIKEISISYEAAHALTQVIYNNLKDAEQGAPPIYETSPAHVIYVTPKGSIRPILRFDEEK